MHGLEVGEKLLNCQTRSHNTDTYKLPIQGEVPIVLSCVFLLTPALLLLAGLITRLFIR